MLIKYILVGMINPIIDFIKGIFGRKTKVETLKDLEDHPFKKEMQYWVSGNFTNGEIFPPQLTLEQKEIIKNIIRARAECWVEWFETLLNNDLTYRGKDIRSITVFQEMMAVHVGHMDETCLVKYNIPQHIIDKYRERIFKCTFYVSKHITAKVALQNNRRSKVKFFK